MTTLDESLMRPGIKKKLNASQRTRLCNLAASKFINAELRAHHRATLDKLAKQMEKDIKAIPAAEMAILHRYSMIESVTGIELPYQCRVKVGVKEFDVDGKIVKRDELETVFFTDVSGNGEIDFENTNEVREFIGKVAGNSDFHVGRRSVIALPKALAVPHNPTSHRDGNIDFNVSKRNGERVLGSYHGELQGFKFSSMTGRLIEESIVAGYKRRKAEREVVAALCKFILAATYWQQIVEFWPEAVEIIDDLFPTEVKPSAALVPINDDDKLLVCRAMSERGINSGFCATMGAA